MKLIDIDTKITALLRDEDGEDTEEEMTIGEFLNLYTVEGLLEIPLYSPGQVPRAKWKLGGYGQISDAGEKWYDKFLYGGFKLVLYQKSTDAFFNRTCFLKIESPHTKDMRPIDLFKLCLLAISPFPWCYNIDTMAVVAKSSHQVLIQFAVIYIEESDYC